MTRGWRQATPEPVLPHLSRWTVDALRRGKLALRGANPPPAVPWSAEAELLLSHRVPARVSSLARELMVADAWPTSREEARRLLGAALRPQAPGALPFSRLADAVVRASDDHPVVGFDIFNTLVIRCVEGEWIKTAVAARLARRLQDIVHPARRPSMAEVRQRRGELEQQVAGEAVAGGEDNEVDYEAMLQRWVGTWVPAGPGRAAVVDETRAWELEIERRALCAAPGIPELLERLRANGKRLIFVSDMYLRSEVLRGLLDHCGIGHHFAAGYASIDFGRRKATGRIFEQVLAKEGIGPKDLLFVGDDPTADCAQPRRHGIRTVNVDDGAERRRRLDLELAERAVARDASCSAGFAAEVIAQRAPERPDDIDYRIGRLLAPSLVGFVLDVVEKSAALGLESLFFLAREGLTFLKVLKLLERGGVLRDLPPQRYLFVSRASTILPSMRELSWEELHRFWRQYPRQSLRALLRNLSLPEAEFLPLGLAAGITNPNQPILDPEKDPAFQRFLASRAVHAAFRRHRDAARARLRRYLEYRGMVGKRRVGLVDIGWKGTMQGNLARAFEEDADFPELHGLYVALTGDGLPPHPKSFKYGYLADPRRSSPEERDFFRNTSIFEMVTTVNHGSTVGYGDHPHAPGLPLPTLLHHDVERENSRRFFRRTQQAVFDYAEEYASAHPLLPFTAEELRPGIVSALMRYTRYPTEEEARRFLDYSHVESFGVHEVTRFGLNVELRRLAQLRLPWRIWRELRRSFETNPWREAVVSRSGLPLAGMLYDAKRTLDEVG